MFHLGLFLRLLKRGEDEAGEPFSAKTKRWDRSKVTIPRMTMKTSLFACAKIIELFTYQNVWNLYRAFHGRSSVFHNARSHEAPVNITSF